MTITMTMTDFAHYANDSRLYYSYVPKVPDHFTGAGKMVGQQNAGREMLLCGFFKDGYIF